MTQLGFQRLSAVPETWAANTLYLIKNPVAGLLDIYVTGADGVPLHSISRSEILALITQETSQLSRPVVVANIAARDALAPTKTTLALVLDATGDATVGSGAALYLFDNDSGTAAWVKVSEYESMDLQFTWAALQGKPTAAVADIDAAVAARHTHANSDVIGKLTAGENGLQYDGEDVYPGVVPGVLLAVDQW